SRTWPWRASAASAACSASRTASTASSSARAASTTRQSWPPWPPSSPPTRPRRSAAREHLAMLAVALALASSVVWGASDFLGGIATRRLTLAPVLVVSQLAGLVLLGVATGLAAFDAALATGTISIVSPVSACGAIVPVGLALARGERAGAGGMRDRARRRRRT